MLVSQNRLLILNEADLCRSLHCSKETLRTHLANYQFAKVIKKAIWYFKNPDDKRKHKTFQYKITVKDVLLLKSMMFKLKNKRKNQE